MPHHSQQLLWNMILKATRKDSLLVCAQRTPERERWRMTESTPGGCQADGLAHGSASAVNLHQSVAHTHSHTHTYCNTLSWSHCVVAREQLGIVTEWFVGLLQRWYWPGNVQGPRLSGPFGDYRARLVLWYCLKHAVLFRTDLLTFHKVFYFDDLFTERIDWVSAFVVRFEGFRLKTDKIKQFLYFDVLFSVPNVLAAC